MEQCQPMKFVHVPRSSIYNVTIKTYSTYLQTLLRTDVWLRRVGITELFGHVRRAPERFVRTRIISTILNLSFIRSMLCRAHLQHSKISAAVFQEILEIVEKGQNRRRMSHESQRIGMERAGDRERGEERERY